MDSPHTTYPYDSLTRLNTKEELDTFLSDNPGAYVTLSTWVLGTLCRLDLILLSGDGWEFGWNFLDGHYLKKGDYTITVSTEWYKDSMRGQKHMISSFIETYRIQDAKTIKTVIGIEAIRERMTWI
jgi:hypothetical protein